MKATIVALPTLLLIAVAILLGHSQQPSTIPATVRAQQLQQLDRDLNDLTARRRQLAAQPTAPFLPRGGLTPAVATAAQIAPWATASSQ
ncbi:MAG: hypothetical protein V4555_13555 [Acidobacteriota bacterium]